MKKQIVKEFITVKKVRYLPREAIPPPPPPAPRKRVLVVGRCTLDIVNVCDEQPRLGFLNCTQEGSWRPGAYAANICFVLRRLGTECEFLGLLSTVSAFESLTSVFQASGVDISNCPRTNQMPAHRHIFTVRGQNLRTTVEYSTRKHELTYQQFVGAVDYRTYNWIHFEPRNFKETQRMMHAVRDHNARSPDANIVLSINLFDLRPLSILLADFADYVFIRKQVKTTYGFMTGREIVWAARDKMRLARKRWLAKQPKKSPYIPIDDETVANETSSCITQTEREPIIIYENYTEGASCLMPDDVYFKVGGHKPQDIVDTTGGHETFVGALIYALQEVKLSLRDAMEYGTRASCHKLAKFGFDHLRCMPKDLISYYYT